MNPRGAARSARFNDAAPIHTIDFAAELNAQHPIVPGDPVTASTGHSPPALRVVKRVGRRGCGTVRLSLAPYFPSACCFFSASRMRSRSF